jgi:hypothetical protein
VAVDPALVERVLRRIKRPSDYEYFFREIKSPDWIEPLAKAGLFAKPPGPSVSQAGEQHPFWPQTQYLQRVATAAPALVAKIVLGLPETSNIRVREDILTIAASLPRPYAGRISRHERKWLSVQPYLGGFLPERAGDLIVHLAKQSQSEALALYGELFRVRKDPRTEGLEGGYRRAVGRFDGWDYDRQLRRTAATLIADAPLKVLTVSMKLLAASFELTLDTSSRRSRHDYSYIWRTSIAHGTVHASDVRECLVDVIRDSALAASRLSVEEAEKVLRVLKRWKWTIAQRLETYIAAEGEFVPHETRAAMLLDRDLFDDPTTRGEYALLAEKWFGSLKANEQQTILSWIDEGRPDREQASERVISSNEEPPSNELLDQWDDHYRRDRLSPIHAALPPMWKERYAALIAKYGAPVFDRSLFRGHVGWVSPQSPIDVKQLNDKSAPDVIDFVRSWQADELTGIEEPSRHGLLVAFRETAAGRLGAFLQHVDALALLDPDYVAEFMSEIRAQLKNKSLSLSQTDWESILKLSASLISQNSATESEGPAEWSKRSVADLLETAFEGEDFPPTLLATAYRVIESLLGDADPTPEREKEMVGGLGDPFTISLNTVRGKAHHVLIKFIAFISDRITKPAFAAHRALFDVGQVELTKRLNVAVEPSLTARAVLGFYFGLLSSKAPDWAADHRGDVFVMDPAETQRWAAAWYALISYTSPWKDGLRLLRPSYELAIERLQTRLPWGDADVAHRRLAEHLMIYAWHGDLSPDDEGGLLQKFFAAASPGLRASAIEFIGRLLMYDVKVLPSEVGERLRRLFEWRRRSLEALGKEAKEELSQFGAWFASGLLGEPWSIHALLSCLKQAPETRRSHTVVERLRDLISTYPEDVVQCLSLILLNSSDGRVFYGSTEVLTDAFERLLQAHNPDVREATEELIHHLGAQGRNEFARLVAPN